MPKRSGCLAPEIPANLPCRSRSYDPIGLLIVQRQETQIVQSGLTLDDFLP